MSDLGWPSGEDFAEELLCAGVLGAFQHFGCGPGLDDESVVHEDDVVGDLAGEPDFVCDDDHGEALAS